MPRGDGQVKEVGKFIRRVITENPSTRNRAVADMVIAHFADQQFEVLKLRQYVANVRYAAKKRSSVVSVDVTGQSETVTEKNEPSS